MQPLAQNGYTVDQVKAVLHAVHGSRQLSFRFAQLDSSDQFIRDVTGLVIAGESTIQTDNQADQIKRSGQFQVKDDGSINWLKDRIQVFARLIIPGSGIGYVEWPQGVFLLSSPTRKYQGPSKYRDVQAYDKMQILVDSGFTARYVVTEGTNYVTAVKQVLTDAGITKINIDPTTKTLPTWLDWPPDTSRLEVVNTLLKIINFEPLHVDENGYFTSHQYMTPQQRAEEYTYADDHISVIIPGATDTLDYFNVPNQWVGVVSEPDRTYLTYTYTNSNADSPTSTVNRGMTITKYIQVNAADLDSLQGMVQKQAAQDSQIAHTVNFSTALMPFHSYDDVYHITHSKLGIDTKFEELSWTLPLKAGGEMQHVAKEVVPI
jgi:hypothetical protein